MILLVNDLQIEFLTDFAIDSKIESLTLFVNEAGTLLKHLDLVLKRFLYSHFPIILFSQNRYIPVLLKFLILKVPSHLAVIGPSIAYLKGPFHFQLNFAKTFSCPNFLEDATFLVHSRVYFQPLSSLIKFPFTIKAIHIPLCFSHLFLLCPTVYL